jgi:LAS superfamily LD-carboxypeptidase LdcB
LHKTQPPTECRKVIKAEADFQKVSLDPRVPNKTVCIGIEANQHDQAELLSFLDKNNDVFAWSTSDLVGVSRDAIEHQLQVRPNAKPKKQKLHKMAKEKVQAVKAEVQRLFDVGFIREVAYPQWLYNIIMVKKKNGKCRMCIDLTDLNKCCPKDNFPLPRIDKIVDSIAASKMMALLDCFSGYHQI